MTGTTKMRYEPGSGKTNGKVTVLVGSVDASLAMPGITLPAPAFSARSNRICAAMLILPKGCRWMMSALA